MSASPETPQPDPHARLEDFALGSRIRDLRHSRDFSLKALGARCGLSVALLSQIERGASSPSMRSLRQIAEGLGVTVETLFTNPSTQAAEEAPNIVRHDQRRILNLAHTGISIELLTPAGIGNVQTFFAYIIPGGSSGADNDSHDNSESGVVLTGQLELWIDGAKHLLNPGDSFCFGPGTPHRYLNPGNAILQAYWVASPPIY